MFTDGGDWAYLDIFGIQNDFSRLLSRIEMLFVENHFQNINVERNPCSCSGLERSGSVVVSSCRIGIELSAC